MQITLSGVRVEGRRDPMLEATDLTWSTGECVLVAGEPGHGHTALALVATGRFAPSSGAVRLDGADVPPSALRARTAVVDVPGISEPDDALTLADVVAEGLALAGRRSLPRDVSRWLDERDLTPDRGRRVDQLAGGVRTAVLAALAAEDPDVRFVVLTLPDRHGGEPAVWWETARTLAASGLGVLVQCTRSSARDLGVDLPPARGATLHEPPQVVRRETPGAPGEDDATLVLPPAPVVEPEHEPEPEREPEPAPEPETEVEDELEPSPEAEPRAEEDVDEPVVVDPPDVEPPGTPVHDTPIHDTPIHDTLAASSDDPQEETR
ncbi:ATP-binding cassette domain-containing protein [Isoptericola sp. NPDC057191]|uniref:ATP-binding cassette domain-containing protein n=1 Tax=Isoptericola sp. NPDC057191 TaxID=3346041 RepID=UPI00363CD305